MTYTEHESRLDVMSRRCEAPRAVDDPIRGPARAYPMTQKAPHRGLSSGRVFSPLLRSTTYQIYSVHKSTPP